VRIRIVLRRSLFNRDALSRRSGGLALLSRTASIAATLAVLALLQVPSAGAVTVGAPLDVPANTGQGCEGFVFIPVQVPNCTFFGFDSAGAFTSQTPPGRWVINQARVRTGPRVGPMVFTALRALRSKAGTQGIACCTTVAESQVFVPQPNSVNTVGVSMPVVNTVELIDNEQVEVVDYLGITLLDSASSAPLHLAPGSTAIGSYFIPALRNGQTGAGPGAFNARVLVNAEYQPAGSGPLPPTPVALTNPFAVQRSVALLRRGTLARLAAQVPGPGILRAGSRARARVAGAATTSSAAARTAGAQSSSKRRAKRRAVPKRKLVKAARVTVREAGSVKIGVRLTRWGRKLLARRSRLRLPIVLTYTPTGGSPTSQSRRVTFKRPPTKRKRRSAAR
jgi:hypothetical protein